MRKRTMIAVAVVLMVGLAGAGCAARAGTEGFEAPEGAGSDGEQRLQQQAADALRRWDDAVAAAGGLAGVVLINDPAIVVGTFEADMAGNAKEALAFGAIELAGAPGSLAILGGQVVWADGTMKTVRTMTVDEALADLRRHSPAGTLCAACIPLRVVDATPVTVQVETSWGPATAPAWEFTLAGTSARLRYVAVARNERVTVTPPSWDPLNAPGGLAVESGTVSSDGRALTVYFIGSPGPGSEPCGYDYTAEAVESATAVVVIVRAAAHVLPAQGEHCSSLGARREATATLAAPLDDRAVLEVQQGMPVRVDQA